MFREVVGESGHSSDWIYAFQPTKKLAVKIGFPSLM